MRAERVIAVHPLAGDGASALRSALLLWLLLLKELALQQIYKKKGGGERRVNPPASWGGRFHHVAAACPDHASPHRPARLQAKSAVTCSTRENLSKFLRA